MGPLGLALVKGGIGILGGLLGRSKPISAGDNAYSHTSGIMRAAKDFNINPAFLFGNVGQMGGTPGDNSGFGRAVGDAGMLAADALASKPGVGLLGKLQEENTGLRRQNTSLMLHPTVPGIFARASSNARSSAGVGSVLSGQGDGPSSHDPLIRPPLDPRATDAFTEQTYTNGGQTSTVYVGPDVDQVITGSAIGFWNSVKAKWFDNTKFRGPDPVPSWATDFRAEWYPLKRGTPRMYEKTTFERKLADAVRRRKNLSSPWIPVISP